LDEEKADQLYKKIVSMPASYSPFSIMRGWWIFRKQSETILPGDINDFLWPGKYGYSMEVPLRDHLIVRFFNRKTGESFSYIHSDTTAALVFHGRWEKPILAPGCTHEKFLIDLLGVDIARQWRMNNR
jgi:hypothetical protein